MADINSLKAMVQRKLQERGLAHLWPAIDYIVTRETAGTWDPTIQSGVINKWGTRENSWGLFQLFIEGPEGTGLGYGHTPQELQNPERNTDIALDAIQRNLATGASINEALRPWSVTHGIDAASLIQGGGNMVTPTATPTATAPTGDITPEIIAWLDKTYAGQGALYFSTDPQGWTDYYRKNVLGETGAAEAMTPSESGNLAARQAELTWDMDKWVAEFDRDAKQYGDTMALQKFTDKVTAAQEGRTQAEAAVQYEREFAPPGQTQTPYGGPESAYGQYMGEHGAAPRTPTPFQTTTLPRSYQDVMAQFTLQTPEYAPTPTPVLPSPAPMDVGGGYAPIGVPMGYQGPSADVIAGAGMQPGAANFTPVPQPTITPEVLREVFRRLGIRSL